MKKNLDQCIVRVRIRTPLTGLRIEVVAIARIIKHQHLPIQLHHRDTIAMATIIALCLPRHLHITIRHRRQHRHLGGILRTEIGIEIEIGGTETGIEIETGNVIEVPGIEGIGETVEKGHYPHEEVHKIEGVHLKGERRLTKDLHGLYRWSQGRRDEIHRIHMVVEMWRRM